MTLDPDFKYFLVGKETAQALTHGQAESLPGMVAVFTCDDFTGTPTYWQSAESAFPDSEPGLNPAWMFGESGAHEDDLAQLEVKTKYTTPAGVWADISDTTGGAANNTGRFLVGVKGSGAASMVAETHGDFSGFTDHTNLSVGYAYSNTDGGQRIYVTAFLSPFFAAQVQEVNIYAAYDGEVPPPAAAFWTGFLGGAREIL